MKILYFSDEVVGEGSTLAETRVLYLTREKNFFVARSFYQLLVIPFGTGPPPIPFFDRQ